MSSRTLEVRDLNKQFGKNLVLEDVELDAEPGEIVALVGPSAAGKSTLLRIVAGIEKPSSGTVAIDDRDVTETPSWKRNVAMAFESYVLYPNRSVFENIAFPLRKERSERRGETAAIERQVREIAEVLEIGPLLDRLPHALSGGQRQRVALGRALVRDADVYLLDEPISHLDAKLRHWLRGELRRRLREKGTPTVWATPDGAEAMAVGDRLALIIRGRIVQTGTAEAVYARPATARVAEIVGDPPMNSGPSRAEGRRDRDRRQRNGAPVAGRSADRRRCVRRRAGTGSQDRRGAGGDDDACHRRRDRTRYEEKPDNCPYRPKYDPNRGRCERDIPNGRRDPRRLGRRTRLPFRGGRASAHSRVCDRSRTGRGGDRREAMKQEDSHGTTRSPYRRRRAWIVFGLLAILILALAAACGGDDEAAAPPAAEEPAPPAEPAEPAASGEEPAPAPAEGEWSLAEAAAPYAGTTINVLDEVTDLQPGFAELIPEFEEETGIDVEFSIEGHVDVIQKGEADLLAGRGDYDRVMIHRLPEGTCGRR